MVGDLEFTTAPAETLRKQLASVNQAAELGKDDFRGVVLQPLVNEAKRRRASALVLKGAHGINYDRIRYVFGLHTVTAYTQQEMTMKLTTNVWITVIMTALQAVAQLSDLLPSDWKHYALAAQIVGEALKALLVHFSNPDGTPAQVAYRPVPGRNPLPPGVLMLALVLAVPLSAQTRARPEQLGTDPAPAARVLVVLPSGVVALADMSGLTLDTTGPIPVLRATVALWPRVRSLRWKPVGTEANFTLPERPSAGALSIYRNGLLLTEGDDYTIDAAGTRITLLAGLEARAGDIVRATYFY